MNRRDDDRRGFRDDRRYDRYEPRGGGHAAGGHAGYARQSSHEVEDKFGDLKIEEVPERRRLKLQPRTVKEPPASVDNSAKRSAIFGDAKPRDEREIEKKRSES